MYCLEQDLQVNVFVQQWNKPTVLPYERIWGLTREQNEIKMNK